MRNVLKLLLVLAAVALPSHASAQTRPSVGFMVVTPCGSNLPLLGGGNGSPANCGTTNSLLNITVMGALKGNGSGAISQAACADLTNSAVYCSALVGQLPGTATNDSPATGDIGEEMAIAASPFTTGTVTFTNASPTVVTWTSNTLAANCLPTTGANCIQPLNFTNSGGALPTGITAGTTYYVDPASYSGSTFKIATSVANAIAGTDVNTSSTGTGTQTATNAAWSPGTGQEFNAAALNLPAGNWSCTGSTFYLPVAGTVFDAQLGTVSATIDAYAPVSIIAVASTGTAISLMTGPINVKNTSSAPVYLLANATFGTSAQAGGRLVCFRIR